MKEKTKKHSNKKNIIIITFLIILQFFFLAKPTFADSLWFHQEFPEWYTKAFDSTNPTEIFGERYTAAQVQWVFYSIPAHMFTALTLGRPEPWVCLFSADLASCITGTTQVLREVIERLYNFFSFPIRVITQDNNYQIQGENKNDFSLYSFLYHNGLSGTGHLLRKVSQLSPISVANAQGFGYKHGGAAVQELWKITRNISYSLLILATIIMSFLIMFRVKTSPQTMITVQSAIPKIIAALILITFSYAIAGFLIDVMYVVIGIFSFTIKSSGLLNSNYSATDFFLDLTNDRNVFVLSWQYLILFMLGTIATIFSSGFFGGLLLILFLIVIFFATLFNSVKILWLMIKTYVNVILSIVAAPLQILVGVVNPTGGFGNWIRGFVSNLAVYPTVGIMFFLTFFFAVQAIGSSSTGGGWVSDLLASAAPFQINTGFLNSVTAWDPPLTWGTNSGRFLWMLASFAIYMLIPKVADIIKSTFEGKPFAYGTAIGESATPAIGLGKAGLQWVATGNEIKYKNIPEGGEIPKATARNKKIFDTMRMLGWIK